MNIKKIFGLILVVIGIVSLLNTAGVTDIDVGEIIGTYWPLILIFTGLFNIITGPAPHKGDYFLLVIGLLVQLKILDILNLNILGPLFIIFIGFMILSPGKLMTKKDSKDTINALAVFSGSDIKNVSQNFKGGSAVAMFGGLNIDLRGANIDENQEVVLDLFAAFGGIDILVPREWNVIVKGVPLFGGLSNETRTDTDSDLPVLKVKGVVMFGGIEVSNQ
ncbi:LiaF transmembrane domain-containing protein [Halothermothrix orenii]|uniref:LiaF transmembrane domain-containing protein n=1 Tax=Halothermothrix orenii (strain H 168 / OCM 544 / DSM 9562) TaxID=373903 RepID=B8CWC6_HALOH|nr:LiaF domain-containing protein [Halothermothrix orenii]ACL69595.1 hypothetical protein Hore_08380 [Halothermothrix orenii H 168]